ncbi:hypothetical protein F442_08351 [Phytophthora nicotianae P10297]|uniref:Uncharacterized protein n=1 Tax=Phytophthora nicotianae P10297 TaxID=1317064 RepID=W2ZG77_PHYNI|nr:hypothetical protein F442_08351 [Phytophthora nicotianae P10297]
MDVALDLGSCYVDDVVMDSSLPYAAMFCMETQQTHDVLSANVKDVLDFKPLGLYPLIKCCWLRCALTCIDVKEYNPLPSEYYIVVRRTAATRQ